MNKQTEPFLLDASVAAESSSQVGISRPHESAHLHVAGTATYTDDIPELAGTLHAALGMSTRAHARIRAVALDKVRRAPGVVAVLTAADIPGVNDCGPILHDDPILASDVVASRSLSWWPPRTTMPAAPRAWRRSSTRTCRRCSRPRPRTRPAAMYCRRCT